MKRIVLGHIVSLSMPVGFAESIPAEVPELELKMPKNLSYSIPREPEPWQGKGNRRKPRVK
ncbi:hypothetical protein [Acinetobacter calcoaceticus]